MPGKFDPCGSWQVPHWLAANGLCTTLDFRSSFVFAWQPRQSGAASPSIRDALLAACGLWQLRQPLGLASGACFVTNCCVWAGWHFAQSALPAARVSFAESEAWGSWQDAHSPARTGLCTTAAPAVMDFSSWQLAQSAPPCSLVANGFCAFASAWHELQPDSATGLWTDA